MEIDRMDIIEKIKGFLLKPTETFKKVKEETFGISFKYFITLVLIFSALNAIMISIMWNNIWGSMFSAYQYIPGFGMMLKSGMVSSIIGLFLMFLVFGIIGIFVSGAIIHLGVKLFGGKRGYKETVKAVIYGGTPGYIFGWIPFIGLIFGIWAFILEIFGISELQEMSTGKAVAAILVPVIIFGVLFSIIIAAVVYMYVTSMF